MTLHTTLARVCRDRRRRLGLTQARLAERVGVDRSYIAKVEHGVANPTFDTAERIVRALGLEIELLVQQPVLIGERRTMDRVHGWCSGYIDRRLVGLGWATAREVEIGGLDERPSGWIDLLAFDPRTATLLVIEVKTRIDDFGALERQLAWYERHAMSAATRQGWRPKRIVTCLLTLHSDEVERSLSGWGDAVRRAFPVGADDLTRMVDASDVTAVLIGSRALAVIDPARRGRRWLTRPRVAGGRSTIPYRDYGDAASRMPGGAGLSAVRGAGGCPNGTISRRVR